MHINTVMVDGFWVSFDLENVKDEIMITATFIRNSEKVEKIYNINTLSKQGAHMVAALLDSEFVVDYSKKLIAENDIAD